MDANDDESVDLAGKSVLCVGDAAGLCDERLSVEETEIGVRILKR